MLDMQNLANTLVTPIIWKGTSLVSVILNLEIMELLLSIVVKAVHDIAASIDFGITYLIEG